MSDRDKRVWAVAKARWLMRDARAALAAADAAQTREIERLLEDNGDLRELNRHLRAEVERLRAGEGAS